MPHQITFPVADVYGVPDTHAKRGKFETQLVQGEIFIVTEEKDGWCKGTCAHDHYPGYVESLHLTKQIVSPTHIVTATRSHTYREPSIKSPFISTLGFGSLIKVTGKEEGFVQIQSTHTPPPRRRGSGPSPEGDLYKGAGMFYMQSMMGGPDPRLHGDGEIGESWIFEKHVAAIDTLEKDYIATARKFLGTPYYWGGRSGFGLDCSGLVQVCLARAGIAAARDSDMQESSIGKAVDKAQAGDIVFFKGHVGFMADDRTLLHANAFHMKTVVEPLGDVVGRGNAVTSIRRI